MSTPPLTTDNAASTTSTTATGSQRWSRVLVTMGSFIGLVVALDQASKVVISEWLGRDASNHRVDIAGTWVAFEYVENTGAAFGLLAGRPWLVSVLATMVACAFVVVFWRHLREHAAFRWFTGLILAGALGNMIDRARLGYVVDFIAVGAWPRFNIADSAVTIGLALMFVTALREDSQRTLVHDP